MMKAPSLSAALAALIIFQTAARADDAESQVKDLRAIYGTIEAAKLSEETVKFESKDEPASGTCTLYRQENRIVKAKLSYTMGDHGGSDEYFYYKDGKLIFAFATDSSWRFGGKQRPDGGAGTIDTVAEHRVYFADGKVIRHLVKEASSENAKEIPAMLAKAENKPSGDAKRATLLQRYGNGAPQVKTAADLDKLLTGGE